MLRTPVSSKTTILTDKFGEDSTKSESDATSCTLGDDSDAAENDLDHTSPSPVLGTNAAFVTQDGRDMLLAFSTSMEIYDSDVSDIDMEPCDGRQQRGCLLSASPVLGDKEDAAGAPSSGHEGDDDREALDIQSSDGDDEERAIATSTRSLHDRRPLSVGSQYGSPPLSGPKSTRSSWQLYWYEMSPDERKQEHERLTLALHTLKTCMYDLHELSATIEAPSFV
ncbi:hypothetical protein F5Y18DRAFT_138882 [Xylariaceae sp. FL1019]|nr:hypothetical protein F5Y18DRAFT_138882 [Xylariaceae sp. FL1019]